MVRKAMAMIWLSMLAVGGMPGPANAGGARLYELTENMRVTAHGKFEHRKAVSELMGTADVGTPLCPTPLVLRANPRATSCTINATGSDNISLSTGLGDFHGTFTVVVQGDNAVDSPELVVMKGVFQGKMDFAPAVVFGIPLGRVTGKLTDERGGIARFTGTFRLPFVLRSLPLPDGTGAVNVVACGPQVPCDALAFDGVPTPLDPMSRYDLVTATRPLYLLDDLVTIVPVQSHEFGAGWAAVRFEITF